MLSRISERLAAIVAAHRKVFVAAMIAVALLMWTVAGAAVWFLGAILTDLPDDAALRGIGTMARSATLYDASDRPIYRIFREQRIEVPLSRISPNLIQAIVAVEDQRFFDHGGVDVIRVVGAAWQNVREGWGTEGASTITQQLARQSFLTRDKTVRRKLREIVVAARLEKAFSKEQILEFYLNKVYFGDGLYGAEAASLGYFGKPASQLTVAEAALLAGLVRSPSTHAPTVSLERATARRNAVLQAMRAAGVIDSTTYDEASRGDVVLTDALRGQELYGQYFKEEVRKQLVQQFGWERVYEGGLQVYTTLDLDLQKTAEAEVLRAVTEIEARQARRRRKNAQVDDEPLQAALVALDPHTGEVRAMVGGRSFDASRFNRVTQARRQAGSAFKPFVYAAALERGFTPGTIINALDTPVMTLQGAWVPDDHSARSAMTMRTALRSSSNRAAVRMLQEIGIPAALRSAERFGVGDVPGVPSLALGSGEVTLLSMTSAYAAFANEGMRPSPTLIRRVETADGEVLYSAVPRADRAVSEATAFLITDMLSDVINSGTAWEARRVGFKLPAAGKTGTTNEYRDAWFVGYTPHLATGVWVGYDQPRTIIGGGYASTLAVPLWGRFMAAATRDDKPDRFSRPRTVRTADICRLSGRLATDSCRDVYQVNDEGYLARESMVYTEYFVRGTEPQDYCEGHVHPQPVYPSPVALSTPGPPTPRVPPTPVATSGVVVAQDEAVAPAATAVEPMPEPQRRRGFWSRFFGFGRNSDQQREPESVPPPDAPAAAQSPAPAAQPPVPAPPPETVR